MVLRRFFRIHDSDDRQMLAGAYHDNAIFSYSYHFNGLLQKHKYAAVCSSIYVF